MTTSHPARAWLWLAATLLALAAGALIAGDALTARWLSHLNEHGHAHLHPHGHPFADARCLWGVPNAVDTLSNAVFLLPGLLGLRALRAGRTVAGATGVLRRGLTVFFVGLLLTAWPLALVSLASGLFEAGDTIARGVITAGQDLLEAVLSFNVGDIVAAVVGGIQGIAASVVAGVQTAVDGVVGAQTLIADALAARPAPVDPPVAAAASCTGPDHSPPQRRSQP